MAQNHKFKVGQRVKINLQNISKLGNYDKDSWAYHATEFQITEKSTGKITKIDGNYIYLDKMGARIRPCYISDYLEKVGLSHNHPLTSMFAFAPTAPAANVPSA